MALGAGWLVFLYPPLGRVTSRYVMLASLGESLRGGVATAAERHPNSHQRTASWCGGGDFQMQDESGWRSHVMRSDAGASLDERWISIPPNAWHQLVVGQADWVVVSFHTVPAAELIEERPEREGPEPVRARKYLQVRQASRSLPQKGETGAYEERGF